MIFLLSLGTLYIGWLHPFATPCAASASENQWAGTLQRSPDLDRGRPGWGSQDTRGRANGVDRDLYPYHAGDVNRFGDDGGYNSITGGSALGGLPPIHEDGP